MDRKLVRKRKRLFRYAVDNFIDILGQITKKKINYKCNNADNYSWELFMDTFSDNVGEEFVMKYLQYGLNHWFNDSKKDNSKRIRFNWIFGKSSIKRWKKKDISTNVYITRVGLKKNYDIDVVKKTSKLNEIFITIRQSEENYKVEFLNTKRGLLWCVANTTLYFHKSGNCAICENKKICKEILKEEYPKIYKIRGYGEK